LSASTGAAHADFAQARKRRNEVVYMATPHSIDPPHHDLRIFPHIGGNEPVHAEFAPRTMWSLSNAFTSAFKELEPIPQYKATAKLAGFLESVRLS
jgi:hypothetical protein